MRKEDITIIICSAGMGTRLGIGSTKALVDICGVPLIIRQLKMLEDYDDIRIVVGYQANRVIDMVKNYRNDIMFAFNYQYRTTGVADSLKKGLIGSRRYVVAIDGDVLTNPEDFKNFMQYPDECICCSKVSSSEPIYINVDNNHTVCGFNKRTTNLEWSGIAKIKSERIHPQKQYVYEVLEDILPLHAIEIRARDLDTAEDYDSMIEWFRGGCCN